MRKTEVKKHILGKKQKRILIFLAEDGPHTINATNTKLFSLSHYHATHTAFKSLESKRLISKLPNGKYYATEEGRFTALLYGANIKKVKETALKFCKPEEKEDLMVTYEIIESVGPETASVILRALKGKTELAYLPLDENEAKKIFSILRKYPKWWAHVEKILRGVEHE